MPFCINHNWNNAKRAATALFVFGLTAWAGALQADETPAFVLTIREHGFDPETLRVPAGVEFTLVVDNTDPTSEEFESYALNGEQVVPGKTTVDIYIGPLDPGTHPFFGEFNQSTAKARIIAE